MDLGKKIKNIETVKRCNCLKCGNPWYFNLPYYWECTTCGSLTKKDD